MANERDKTEHDGDDEASLAGLMKLAGERPEIPLGIESRVYHRVREEWRSSTAQPGSEKVYDEVHRSWRRAAWQSTIFRWLAPGGLAVAAVLAVVFMYQPAPSLAAMAATVSRTVGHGPAGSRYPEGASVRIGELVSTGTDEGLSLLLARSESLRVDENTRIRVDAADRFTLLSGRVYIDTGLFVYRDGGLTIDTAFGSVTDVGTQFSVAIAGDSLDVAVREGRVDVADQSERYSARVGERLMLTPGQDVERTALDTHDDYWGWIAGLAPSFDTANKSLLDFLKWAARETGRELQFEGDESRMFAMQTDVHGSIAGLTPDEALESILATTSVRYRVTADKVLIEQ